MDNPTEARPMLAHAREAAEELLMRKVAEGAIAPDTALDMGTTGFNVTTRVLADLRRQGVSEQCIVESFQRKPEKALEAGDGKRVTAAEFTLAVWDGMQRDLAEYLRATPETRNR